MKLFGLGMPELIIILLVILVIFGPKNLPKLGSALGKAVKGVREGVDSVNSELDAAKESVDTMGKDKGKKGKNVKEDESPITATAVVEDVPVSETTVIIEEEAPSDGGFCSQCGAPLESDARFCKKCGAANS
ncbi:MAG: twin-arginine translocase TatA/TatE family subunit [Coriobacteriales bacterium]|jgi:sec-independent protein translocase protein TatA|nr:twin-arginine translocase TatA/TatE family subunit [Coriobacteriales bacterium]